TTQHAVEQLNGDLLPMKDRPMMLRKVAFARVEVELSPGTATGMAVGTEVAQPEPAAIAAIAVGTKMPRRIHRPGAAVRERQGIGPDRRRCMGLLGCLLTQVTVRIVCQALECFWL